MINKCNIIQTRKKRLVVLTESQMGVIHFSLLSMGTENLANLLSPPFQGHRTKCELPGMKSNKEWLCCDSFMIWHWNKMPSLSSCLVIVTFKHVCWLFIKDFIEHASEEVHWVKYGRRHEELPCPLLLGTPVPQKLYGLSYLGSISPSPLRCFLSFQVFKNWHMLIICNNGLHCDILVCGYVIWSYSHMPPVPHSHWCIAECLAAFLTSSHHMLWHSPIHTNQMSPDVR